MPDDLLDELQSLPTSEGYSDRERYADFSRLFLGSDQGRRVLRELVARGRLFRPKAHGSPIDTNKVMIEEGEQNYVRWLLYVIYNEPKQKPPKQKRGQNG